MDLDWRFLLPLPSEGPARQLLLLGGSRAAADELAGTGIADEVLVEPNEAASIVACLGGARVSLREAAARLAPGGILYYESVRPLRRDPLRCARRLGLSVAGLYWVHPGLTGPRTYVPLDVEWGLRWYLEHLRVDRGRVADAAARAAIALGPRRLSLVVPRLALVAVAGAGRELSAFAARGLPPVLREAVRPVALSHGDELSRVVLLPFTRGSQRPVAVVKLYRRSLQTNEATTEHAVLGRIRERLSPELRTTVPEPLATAHLAGGLATVESFLEGDWLLALWAGRRSTAELDSDLETASVWLAKFHLQTTVERRPWRQDDIERSIGPALAAYKEVFGATDSERRLFEQLERQARDAVGAPLPVVWHHTDFSSLNVVRRERTVGVIDWENAAPGLPLDDLLYFVTRWLYRTLGVEGESEAERAVAAEAFCRLFFEAGSREHNVERARGAITRYVHALELDDRLVPLLFAHAWLTRAVGRLRREAGTGSATGASRDGNRYVTLVGITAAHAERLSRGGLPWVD